MLAANAGAAIEMEAEREERIAPLGETRLVRSKRHAYTGAWRNAETTLTTCGGTASAVPLAMAEPGEVVFTYDVKWEYSEIKWASRWDTYLLMGDEQIHWHSCMLTRTPQARRACPLHMKLRHGSGAVAQKILTPAAGCSRTRGRGRKPEWPHILELRFP